MKINFPSREFDEAVAAVCHGTISEEQARGLNEVLRNDAKARDEYLLRVELHARLASDPDLFATAPAPVEAHKVVRFPSKLAWGLGLAACVAFLAVIFFRGRPAAAPDRPVATSKSVAMLNRTVDAHWKIARSSGPIEPGWLRLESGLAQVVFYSGARVVIEGPAEMQLISASEAFCKRGRLVADVPAQAHGFRIQTPHAIATEAGNSFGIVVKENETELDVFSGSVQFATERVKEGSAAIAGSSGARRHSANSNAFAALFELREKSGAVQALRYEEWRAASDRINGDRSLVAHYDFQNFLASGWEVRNLADKRAANSDAVIVGCRGGEGRWPEKRALEFQSVSDRVRINVPGEFDALTLTTWVCVKGLDRKVNSLLMCDGFQAGTVHWLIRNDGVPGITVIGAKPGDYQIILGPRAVTLEKFGLWLHLAVTIDGPSRKVVQYLNGAPIAERTLQIASPFRIGPAELGNWNAKGFPENDPFMIRNFSGAMDEFCLFDRALSDEEIHAQYTLGKPQGDVVPGGFNIFQKR